MNLINREEWLDAAIAVLRHRFDDVGRPLPSKIRAAVGFPSRAAFSPKRARVGECWYEDNSGDGTVEILISPRLDVPVEVFATLVHELGHAALGRKAGHKKPFARLMDDLLLEGPATATVPGAAFVEWSAPLLERLGPLPHAAISQELRERKEGPCRQLKVSCPEHGYIARVSRKWLDEAGAPLCPMCQRGMVEEAA